ncbi:MAG: PIN domain-containing protein [Dehalococcoidia bacterium]|nr:PIN domain-containing protein [Dehalococcoidia bacterium]
MSEPFIDTDVIIRLLTGDDPKKQVQARALFKQVEAGKLTLLAPETVIADAVFVLSSPRLYHLPRTEIRDLLSPILRLPNFKIRRRLTIFRALDIYAATNLDFGDAFIVASMEVSGSNLIYSYDRDFDHIPNLTRLEPTEQP